jgi:phenylalanyl-tRNA synthetase alpha chain
MRPIPALVSNRIGWNLHNRPDHPLGIIKTMIQKEFPDFSCYDTIPPVVSVKENFDSLLVPEGHACRAESDTFYLTETTLLRTHTSAHQNDLLRKLVQPMFLVTGDVYRRDEVDAHHYPVFHQMEGVCLCDQPEKDLHLRLGNLLDKLFPNNERRVITSSFPFTDPSWEYEILLDERWVEVLGCGVVRKEILEQTGWGGYQGWAFGLGLERLAMILFGIPDIRLFWSKDERFTRQFRPGHIDQFEAYSSQPPCVKDISFWVPVEYYPNDFHAIVRDVGGDLVEDVRLIDEFRKSGRVSKTYRIILRSHDHTLTNDEAGAMITVIKVKTAKELGVEVR